MYIDRQHLIERLKVTPIFYNDEYLRSAMIDLVMFQPSADVVAEIENYKQIAEYQQRLNMERYFEVKRLEEELALRRSKIHLQDTLGAEG